MLAKVETRLSSLSVILFALVLCSLSTVLSNGASAKESLRQARAGFRTQLITKEKNHDQVNQPPADMQLVLYSSELGKFPAYISEPPTRGKRYPAIIWIAGGFDSSIDSTFWTPASSDNDQSAMAFREDGIVTMYPSLRGGNNNPGYHECFYGEVDDVIAAAKSLATLPYVDPHRIYLGGHSTGGTLALLTAESTGLFRGVFALGPVSSPTEYGTEHLTFNYNDQKEVDLRSPILYLDAITSPTWVVEGTQQPSNVGPLNQMMAVNRNPIVHFNTVPGKDHFSEIAYITPLICSWILNDTGPRFRGPYSPLAANRHSNSKGHSRHH